MTVGVYQAFGRADCAGTADGDPWPCVDITDATGSEIDLQAQSLEPDGGEADGLESLSYELPWDENAGRFQHRVCARSPDCDTTVRVTIEVLNEEEFDLDVEERVTPTAEGNLCEASSLAWTAVRYLKKR